MICNERDNIWNPLTDKYTMIYLKSWALTWADKLDEEKVKEFLILKSVRSWYSQSAVTTMRAQLMWSSWGCGRHPPLYLSPYVSLFLSLSLSLYISFPLFLSFCHTHIHKWMYLLPAELDVGCCYCVLMFFDLCWNLPLTEQHLQQSVPPSIHRSTHTPFLTFLHPFIPLSFHPSTILPFHPSSALKSWSPCQIEGDFVGGLGPVRLCTWGYLVRVNHLAFASVSKSLFDRCKRRNTVEWPWTVDPDMWQVVYVNTLHFSTTSPSFRFVLLHIQMQRYSI